MKVTCICPTTDSRKEWLPKAIASYEGQTFADKELLIVADAGQTLSPDLLKTDQHIRVVRVPAGMTIGEKRNIACEQSSGSEIIVHFDDDDFSYPGRIDDQVKRLADSGKAVTGYYSFKFTDGKKWWLYHGHPGWAFDASLCYKRDFWVKHPFTEINDGLEAAFRDAAGSAGQLVTVDGSAMMYATIHDGNTGVRVIADGNTTWEELPGA